jgi:hypothetical protein
VKTDVANTENVIQYENNSRENVSEGSAKSLVMITMTMMVKRLMTEE